MGAKERTQINDAVLVVERAIGLIGKMLNNQSKEWTLVLDDCEECLWSIKKRIKQLYGEGLQSVCVLKKMICLVKNLKECNCVSEDVEIKYHNLQKLIKDIKEILKNELKKEVVFLPYKASMWDSLESVWKAMMEDENYVVRVMPIPYYDRDKEGNLSIKHWEGDLFPDYVPITSWNEYELEEHCPDMIFIHNPYDEYNRVTSVFPEYYSSRLKNYTESLVYIPYFVLEEINPKNVHAIEERKHYILVPAVFNSDKVIVQSESMKEVYVNVLSQMYGENSRLEWTEKILGLGSPKIDKALDTNKQNIEIPTDWSKKLKKINGTWKKIVFYNVSLGILLRYSDYVLDKMAEVLETFRLSSDEIGLIWRPHPLYRSTMLSMRPNLVGKYDELVEKFKSEAWGVYDDSADMNRTIALSDAYFGDGSSVARVYEKCGKRFLHQDVLLQNNRRDKEMEPLIVEDILLLNEEYIFILRDINAVCSLEIKTGRINILGMLPEKISTEKKVSSKLLLWKQKIIFVPTNLENLWLFDRKNMVWDKIELHIERGGKDKFIDATVYRNKVILLGYNYPGVVIVNLETQKVNYIKADEAISEYGYALSNCEKIKNILYATSSSNNKIMILDMDTEQWEWKALESKVHKYAGVIWDGKYFWLASIDENVMIRWNGMDEFNEYDLSSLLSGESKGFCKITFDKKHIFLMSNNGKILSFDAKNFLTIRDVLVRDTKYVFYKIDEDLNEISISKDGAFCIRQGDIEIVNTTLRLEEREIERYILQDPLFLTKPYWETKLLDLDMFLSLIKKKSDKVVVRHNQSNVGDSIYKALCKE